MKIRTKEPNWIRMSEAARKIDASWVSEDLGNYMVENGYATKHQLNYGERIPNIIQKRPDFAITDYFYDDLEVADSFIEHIISERKERTKNN